VLYIYISLHILSRTVPDPLNNVRIDVHQDACRLDRERSLRCHEYGGESRQTAPLQEAEEAHAGMACRGFPGGAHIRTETYAYESAQTSRQSSRRTESREEVVPIPTNRERQSQ